MDESVYDTPDQIERKNDNIHITISKSEMILSFCWRFLVAAFPPFHLGHKMFELVSIYSQRTHAGTHAHNNGPCTAVCLVDVLILGGEWSQRLSISYGKQEEKMSPDVNGKLERTEDEQYNGLFGLVIFRFFLYKIMFFSALP